MEQLTIWSNAYDEEGAEGQGGTALKPHGQQIIVAANVSFTVGDVFTASGTKRLMLIEVIARVPQGVHVFGHEPWGVGLTPPDERWDFVRQDRVSEEKRVRAVSLDDPMLFPLQVVSRQPRTEGGRRRRFSIETGGSAKEVV